MPTKIRQKVHYSECNEGSTFAENRATFRRSFAQKTRALDDVRVGSVALDDVRVESVALDGVRVELVRVVRVALMQQSVIKVY